MVEHADTVAEHYRGDAHQDLVQGAGFGHCLAMLAPRTLTYLSPAATFACANRVRRCTGRLASPYRCVARVKLQPS